MGIGITNQGVHNFTAEKRGILLPPSQCWFLFFLFIITVGSD